jgi:predicted DNA-binding ribbon-helix-helix protein
VGGWDDFGGIMRPEQMSQKQLIAEVYRLRTKVTNQKRAYRGVQAKLELMYARAYEDEALKQLKTLERTKVRERVGAGL